MKSNSFVMAFVLILPTPTQRPRLGSLSLPLFAQTARRSWTHIGIHGTTSVMTCCFHVRPALHDPFSDIFFTFLIRSFRRFACSASGEKLVFVTRESTRGVGVGCGQFPPSHRSTHTALSNRGFGSRRGGIVPEMGPTTRPRLHAGPRLVHDQSTI